MNQSPQLYLVPCSCGELLRVRSRQAGEELICKCGATVAVPTIRGLQQLKTVDDESEQPAAAPSRWQGPLFSLGLTALLLGCAVLLYTFFVVPADLNLDVKSAGMTEAQIKRREKPVDQLTLPELYDEFYDLQESGQREMGKVAQSAVDSALAKQRRRRTIGGAIAACGALLTVIGLCLPHTKPAAHTNP